ncbi:hypothetical protein E6W99_14920 [Metabacillus sediminilitoris]|uniref:Uncharacterized protein n=1 Tax=Metabacillus sediminilitoris TaxID=2567941 RepID=A0A4S4BX08_9BACI|nr:hypothetical protein E6W99_14920 [Metabacillus sediminilitoris]
MIGADCETPAGAAGQVSLIQAFTPRRLTARPVVIVHPLAAINHTARLTSFQKQHKIKTYFFYSTLNKNTK